MSTGDIAHIIEAAVASFGIIFAVVTYVRKDRHRAIRKLAKQLLAYYAEEQEAVKKMKRLGDPRPEQTIQQELRSLAEKSSHNTESERPTMHPSKISRYL